MPFIVNDPGHVAEHNRLAQALPPGFVPASTDSPALTGTPTAPTPANGDSSGNIATTEFVTENAVAAPPDSVQTAFRQITNVTGRQPADANSGGMTRAWLAKPHGDGMPGVFDMLHHDTYGYLFHLQTGTVGAAPDAPGAAPAFLIACGLDTDDGAGGPGVGGILIANKQNAQGIQIHQQSGVYGPLAFGLYGYQESTAAPMMHLEVAVDGGAPLFELKVVTPAAVTTTTQMLATFKTYGNHLSGQISAYDGSLQWIDKATFRDTQFNTTATASNGIGASTPAKFVVTDPATNPIVSEWSADTDNKSNGSLRFYRATGSSTYWASRIEATAQTLALQASPAAAKGSETWTTVIGIQNNALGFFTTSPKAQHARLGALTDSSGGTSGGSTVGAVTDFPSTANAIATLTAKVNALEALLSAAGGGFGLTA